MSEELYYIDSSNKNNPPVEDTTIKNQRKLQKIEWPELNQPGSVYHIKYTNYSTTNWRTGKSGT